MVVENFKDGDAKPIYKRFEEKGRLAPVGLRYVSSWVDSDLKICFQLMETDDRKLLDQWIENWKDLVDFKIFPVITSKEAAAEMNKRLDQ